jgi:hypothetical protein
MRREIITTRVSGDAYGVEIKGKHTVRMDQPTAAAGTDTGPNPTDVWVAYSALVWPATPDGNCRSTIYAPKWR